jgi:RNA recognition motif-containing protein
MGTRLYVGNLSGDATADSVRAVFAPHGEVSDVHIVCDRDTGRPRGFAFVTMGTSDQASAAATKMNGAMVDGRPLRVNEADTRRGAIGPRR